MGSQSCFSVRMAQLGLHVKSFWCGGYGCSMRACAVMHGPVSCGCNGADQLTIDPPVALLNSNICSLHASMGFVFLCVIGVDKLEPITLKDSSIRGRKARRSSKSRKRDGSIRSGISLVNVVTLRVLKVTKQKAWRWLVTGCLGKYTSTTCSTTMELAS